MVAFGTITLCYDQNGNLVNDGGRQYTWNAENQPLSISQVSGSESYGYDGDGERAKKVRGSTTTIYLERLWEEVAGGAVTSLYPFNGVIVALCSGTTVSYLHADHLGSVNMTTDPGGAVARWQEFNPWGKIRAGGVTRPLSTIPASGWTRLVWCITMPATMIPPWRAFSRPILSCPIRLTRRTSTVIRTLRTTRSSTPTQPDIVAVAPVRAPSRAGPRLS